MRALILDRATGNPYSRGLAGGLRDSGLEVVLAGSPVEDGQEVVAVFPTYGVAGARLRKAAELPGGLFAFARLLAHFRPQIVHVQWHTGIEVLYTFLARLAGARIAFTAHNPAPRDAARLQSALLRSAAAVFVHGPRLRDELIGRAPYLDGRVWVVEHGNYAHVARPVPVGDARRELALPDDVPVLAFVGQISARKGIGTLIDAFARYRHAGGRGVLLVAGTAGPGSPGGDARARAESLGLPITWIVRPDALPDRLLDTALSAADAVVLPFVEASQSGSAILAMTHGRCVIAPELGELGRTLEGRGLLVPPRDPAALARTMKAVDEEPERVRELGLKARQYALEELSWQRVAAATADVYSMIIP